MPFFAHDGVTLHYAWRAPDGAAPTLLFANSLGTDFRVWDDLVALLSPGFGILHYDKRGHGLSDLSDAPGSLNAHVADVAALMEHVGLGAAVVCGLSVGGVIAQQLAIAAPERVRALILSNTATKIGRKEDWEQRIEAVEAGGIAALSETVMQRWFSPTFHAQRPAELAGMTNMLVRQSAQSYAAIAAMLADTDLTEAARTIAAPTLCIAGERDGSTPPDVVRALAETIPTARYSLIEGVGHIPCVEAPTAVAERITQFLEEVGDGG